MTDSPPAAARSPLQLTIARPERFSRGLALLGCLLLDGRALLLIPIYIVLTVVGAVAYLVAWLMQFVVLFTGRYPEGAHRFITGYLRWFVRAMAFHLGVVDRYPTTMKP